MRGPGVPAGVTRDEYALNIDYAPTFAELGGATPTDFTDGRSLVPLLLSDEPIEKWRRDFLVELWRPAILGGDEIRALRMENAVGTARPAIYAEYLSGGREVYDLLRDPFQIESLHRVTPPGHQKQWSRRLIEVASCAGESCRH